MRLNYYNDQLTIDGDEDIIAKAEGEDLSGVKINGRVDGDALARAYNDAEKGGLERAKYYAAVKEAFVKQHKLRHSEPEDENGDIEE
ncbi:hypothetical protein [Evansella halocellulosilytica]|uniref:hypothetical protein n=1 Tax=Evansella halocellulosilytica TaxID=2011013 RepID=UPI000BB906E5|nr:hypothetical protein [Evansella halocellulosilytica]